MINSFSLSLELVLLMSWLLKNEKEEIKKLIEKTIKNGFINELAIIDNINTDEMLKGNSTIPQHLSDSILDFLDFLEETLLKSLDKEEINRPIIQDKLKNEMQRINKQNIDPNALWLTIQQTKNKFSNSNKETSQINPIAKKDEEAKKFLFSQLLKNWKPKINDPIN